MLNRPIEMNFKSAETNIIGVIGTFTSYHFERNMLSPAAAFRFTAPGVEKALRKAIRSGDTVLLYCFDAFNNKIPLATGFIDETDTHVLPDSISYVLTGRDTLGQLVDNDSVDANNKIVHTQGATLKFILETLIKNTRIIKQVRTQQAPNGTFLFQTNPGESKAATIQRYLEFTNCLMWTTPDGVVVLGKPNFKQQSSGRLVMNSSDPSGNNCLEGRARRNLNQVIRSIVTQLQGLQFVDAEPYTVLNNVSDLRSRPGVGRSLFRFFSYGSGNDTVNTLQGVGAGGSPFAIGNQLSQNEIARDNVKVLDVELVVKGHLNNEGGIFNIDQIYDVQMEDDDVNEPMYVYSCTYDMTKEHGMLTRLRLCKLNTLCATAEQL